MYSKNSWGGSEEPAILMNFENSTHRDHDGSVVSLVIFEWQDQKLLGFIANEDDLEVRISVFGGGRRADR